MFNKQEAWYRVADLLLEKNPAKRFICNIIKDMYRADEITNNTKLQMISDLGIVTKGNTAEFHKSNSDALDMNWTEYGVDLYLNYDDVYGMKATLCLFISQLSESELEELVNEQSL